jgi:hypothetical protein
MSVAKRTIRHLPVGCKEKGGRAHSTRVSSHFGRDGLQTRGWDVPLLVLAAVERGGVTAAAGRPSRPSWGESFRREPESMMVRFAADSRDVTLRLTALRSIDGGAVVDNPEEGKAMDPSMIMQARFITDCCTYSRATAGRRIARPKPPPQPRTAAWSQALRP